jgi:adenosylhomocysteine nucleosidase
VSVLAFVAAERRELDGILSRAAGAARLRWPVEFAREFVLNGQAAIAVADGPGPKLAGCALDAIRERREIRAVVSVGYCGALKPGLDANDIAVATRVNNRVARMPEVARAFTAGPVLSADRVVTSVEEKSGLARTGAIAVEMEAEALAERAESWGVPFYCVRVVTDTAAEALPLDFNALRDAGGRFRRWCILLAALRRPAVLAPRLVRLDRRCRDASAALGDFIADCRF